MEDVFAKTPLFFSKTIFSHCNKSFRIFYRERHGVEANGS